MPQEAWNATARANDAPSLRHDAALHEPPLATVLDAAGKTTKVLLSEDGEGLVNRGKR
jgi:hypothetical protein